MMREKIYKLSLYTCFYMYINNKRSTDILIYNKSSFFVFVTCVVHVVRYRTNAYK